MINYAVAQNVAVIRWNMSSSPMNVLNDESIPQFEEALNNAYADEAVTGIIITSDKPEFVAGADLKMILRNSGGDPAAMMQVSMELNRIFRKMETSGKPIVAAINGTALGGGYEICLACHHRIALSNPKTQIGLVEVTIGLLPGGGGTQRLPRMIGMQAALPLLVEGKKLNVADALKNGLIDDVAETPTTLMDKARAWIMANPNPIKPWDQIDKKTGKIVARDNFKVPGGNVQSPTGAQTFAAGTAMLMDKTKGNYPAPIEIMACVYEGLQVNIDRALVIEARHFVKVATSKVAKSLIQTMFLGMNEANKGASRPKDQPRTEVKKLGILGAGMMGAGIAYVSAVAGIEVVLKDVSAEAAEKGKDYTRSLLKKGVDRGKVDPTTVDTTLNRIKATGDYTDLDGCDMIIEAVFENRELKATVTKEAEPKLAQTGVYGSNTSTLPITGLAEAAMNPANFIGIHFFSPVDKMMLVEIIMGKETSDYALAVAMDYTRKIRKTPIVVNDSRGFYTSRCFGTYTAEGMELLKDGVNPILIENAGKDAGMPVGPLAVHDEVALDLSLKVMTESVKAGALSTDEPIYQMVQKFNAMGRIGKKAKAGFYDYPDDAASTGGKKTLWPGLAELYPISTTQPSLDEVKTRLLYRQAIEAVRCFEEGVIRTKLDADLGSILAWGFPAYTGGALSFVDFVGIDIFVQTLDRLADAYGDRFRPTTKLRERVGLVESV